MSANQCQPDTASSVTRPISADGVAALLDSLTSGRRIGLSDIQSLVLFWLDLSQRHPNPQRKDFAPHELIFILPDMWMMDVRDPKNPRFRLVGTRLSTAFRNDPTGMLLSDVIDQWRIAPMRSFADAISKDEGPWVIHTETIEHSHPTWQFQGAAMPIYDEDGAVSIILGAGQFRSFDDNPPKGEVRTRLFRIA